MTQLSEDSLALVTEKQRGLALNFVTEINKRHAQSLTIDDQLRELVGSKIDRVMEIATLLDGARKTFRHLFDELVGKHLNFGPKQLRGYFVVGKRPRPAPDFKSRWKSLRDMGPTSDLLPLADGHGEQHLRMHPNFFSVASRQIEALLVDYRKYLMRRKLDSWSSDELEQFAAQLKPLVDAYAQVQKRVAQAYKAS